MLDKLNLPNDLTNTLKIILNKCKEFDPHINEEKFIEIIFKQWLEQYKLPQQNKKIYKKNQVKLKNDLKMTIVCSDKTQKQIAEEIGINYSYLNQIINGVNEPSITLVLLLIQTLNYPPQKITELFFLEPIP